MSVNNVYHEAGVENVHEGIVKAEGRVEACEGVVPFEMSKEFDNQTKKRIQTHNNQ